MRKKIPYGHWMLCPSFIEDLDADKYQQTTAITMAQLLYQTKGLKTVM